MGLITITSYTNATEANIARGKLLSCGIQSFLTHENFINLMPHFSGILNKGIELKVMSTDYEEARKILMVQEQNVPQCPRCGSRKFKTSMGKKKGFKWLFILLSLLVVIPFNNINTRLVCCECGEEIKWR